MGANSFKPLFQSPCGEVIVKGAEYSTLIGRKKFQSPCGEVIVKGCSISQENMVLLLFQSPCGEVIVKAYGSPEYEKQRQSSFSPLAGK